MSALRDTVYAWYPECNYNTHAYWYWGLDVSDSPTNIIVTELVLVKFDGYGGREVVDRRYDTWELH